MTGKLQLPVIIPSAAIEMAQEIRKLGRRPIAFEETLGHHPQQATCMLAVYAFSSMMASTCALHAVMQVPAVGCLVVA